MSILIESPIHIDGTRQDIYIEDRTIQHIGEVPPRNRNNADHTIKASKKLISPSLKNGHTHAGMSLLRGWEDDLPLQTWLEEKIWPVEEHLTPEDIYWGTRLACLEMIKSGTTFCNDMYWEFDAICRAVSDSGMRARVSGVFIDHFDEDIADQQIEQARENAEQIDNYPDRVQFALGPHATYTVSRKSLEWAGTFSRENEIPLNIHLAETKEDVNKCKEQFKCTPIEYLDRLGALHAQTVLFHGIWVTKDDVQRIAEREAQVVYNPISNLKLASGMDFPLQAYQDAGVSVCLGTDGVASNNNHDLFEEIKMAALLQKQRTNDPEALPASEAFRLATSAPADIFDTPCGTIQEGERADLILVDLTSPSLTPLHEEESHLTYAASGGCVDTVICDGELLMENRQVREESKIRDRATEHAMDLINRHEP